MLRYSCDLCGREFDSTGECLFEFFSWEDDKTDNGSNMSLNTDKVLVEINFGRAYNRDHKHIRHICIFCIQKMFNEEAEERIRKYINKSPSMIKTYWICSYCGLRNINWADKCGRCETNKEKGEL